MNHLAVLLAALAVASARNTDVRIVGGTPTAIEKYPHQVGINVVGKGSICGGCLVSIQHVLTAAHCVYGKPPQNVTVRVGTSYRLSGGNFVEVQNLTVHKKYEQFVYDIAVVKLLKPVTISASVRPISLVPVQDKRYVGEMLTAIGWGLTAYDENDDSINTVLRVVRIPVVDRFKCEAAHEKYIYLRTFCAGGNLDQGVYYGDSGGPAINGKGQLVGIVSWGAKGNITGKPAVFSDLTYPAMREFVIQNMK